MKNKKPHLGINLIIYIPVLIVISIIGYFLHCINFLEDNSAILRYFGYSLASLSVLFTAHQFRFNNMWQKKKKH